MKHSINVFVALLSIFLAAQVIGLFVVNSYVDVSASQKATQEAGRPVAVYQQLPYGVEPPDISPDTSWIYMGVAILIGTGLMLLIIKFRKASLWRIWFLLATIITLSIAFASFLPAAVRYGSLSLVAVALAVIVAYFKIFRANLLAHNLGELFIYGGLAALFVQVMDIKSASILLILISIYDFIAVFMSKHMITLAKFQSSNKIFAGLLIPKQLSAKSVISEISQPAPESPASREKYSDSGSYAVIGGGDIGFPLLFAGTTLINFGFFKALIIPAFAAVSLAILLLISKRGKFYPAMPFITAGCFIGYFIAAAV